MSLEQIENLSVQELKSQRDSLVEESAKSDPKELAARYIKARTDAAMRDEKLSEQGKTITLLQENAETVKGQVAELMEKLNESLELNEKQNKQIENLEANHKSQLSSITESHQTELAKLREISESGLRSLNESKDAIEKELATTKQALNEASALAKNRRTALSTIMQTISPLLADEG